MVTSFKVRFAAVKVTAIRCSDLRRHVFVPNSDFVRRLKRHGCSAIQGRLDEFKFFIGKFCLLLFVVHGDELHGVSDDVLTVCAVGCDLDPSSLSFWKTKSP